MDQHKSEKSKESTPTSTESKGMLGSVWSAAGAILQNAVQGTIDAAYQTADRVQPVANKVAESATSAIESIQPVDTKQEIKKEPAEAFFSSPTNDMMQASKPAEPSKDSTTSTLSDVKDKAFELADTAKKTFSEALSNVTPSTTIKAEQLLDDVNRIARDNIQHAIDTTKEKESISNEVVPKPKLEEGNFKLELTMDVVAHLQRIADRTGDKILHETARKAHSACAKGVSDAPGVHLVRVTPEQATELVNLAILTQDHELADFARYCQSVAATTQIGIEPTPGKIKEELEKGKQELSKQGRMHTGPGYGAAFASVGRSLSSSSLVTPPSSSSATQDQLPQQQQQQQLQQPLQQIKQEESATTAAPAGGMQLTMDMVAHLQRIADRTGDKVLHDTARKAHSACAKNLSDAPGVHLVSVTPDQASELVNLAIRTQDHELANFARYCQSVAATSQLGIEPSPGKIKEEIEKGRQELQQQDTGPGYGAAFASISRSNSAQNLKTSRSSSPTNVPISPSPQLEQQLQQQQQLPPAASPSSAPSQPALQLSMDVVAHLQRIADRTGDALLHETARKAHSACAKNLNEAPGVHLTCVTPEQATELVNLAIRTQDHELADFARYCQSVAATTQVAVEPSPGKIKEEIEKGRQELLQQGRSHTGPGYGAAFASKQAQPKTQIQQQQQQQQIQPEIKIEQNVEQVKPTVGLPSQ